MMRCGGASPSYLHFSSLAFFPSIPQKPNPNPSLLNPRCLPISSSPLTPPIGTTVNSPSPMVRKRKRYRKLYPGEAEGIAQEMRFVAMKLRNAELVGDKEDGESWQPSMNAFLKYLVDSKLVFDTIERIVDESADVSYAYFRKTGLERSSGLVKDLEWFSQQGMFIPQQSSPGISYARYLEELAEKSAPSFLTHFYNIYFAHIAGGRSIGEQVCEKLLQGRELEFYKWEGDVQDVLKDVRGKLNKLGEHWSRDDKNRCLRETAKSFKFLGQIVRLIIL